MSSGTDADRMRAAVARLAEASASLAELLLGPSAAHGAAGAATSEPLFTADGGLLVAGAGAVSAPEAPSKNSPPDSQPREVVFSAPTQRPRVLGLDEGEARLLLANVLSVLEHARARIHPRRKPQLEAVARQIRTALDGQRGRTRSHGPPDSGDVAVAA